MSYSPILGNPKPQYEDGNGVPYVGMRLFTYAAGTSTKLASQTDSTGATDNTNPIVLDADGFPTGNVMIYGTTATTYKIVAAPAGSDDPPTSPLWTIDNIVAGETVAEWITSTTAIRTTTTTFTVVGDQTATFHANRRVKCTGGADRYARIVSSAFTTLTTVTVVVDGSNTLHASMDTVFVGIHTTGVTSAAVNYYALDADETLAEVTNYTYPIFDIRRYGALGDGTTDDSTSINAAIKAAANKWQANSHVYGITVRVPSGYRFRIDSTILIPRGVNLAGDSIFGAEILSYVSSGGAIETATYDSGSNALTTNVGDNLATILATSNVQSNSISNLTLRDVDGNSTGAVINLNGMFEGAMHGVYLTCSSAAVHGINLEHCWALAMIKVSVEFNDTPATPGDTGVRFGASTNIVSMQGCNVIHSWDIGIALGQNGGSLEGCRLENIQNADDTGIAVLVTNNGHNISGCYFESSDVAIALGSASAAATGCEISGCYFESTVTTSVDFVKAVGCKYSISNQQTGITGDAFGGTASTTDNYNSVIEVRGVNGSTERPTDYNLNGVGRHVLKIWGNTAGDHQMYGEYNTENDLPLEKAASQFGVRGTIATAIEISITNDGGVIKHKMTAPGTAAASAFDDIVVAPSASYAATPSVAAGVDFVTGGGLVSGAVHSFLIDSLVDQNNTDEIMYITSLTYTDVSATPILRAEMLSSNVSGVTWLRPVIRFSISTGANWSINTTNITAGETLSFLILGFLR